MIIARVVLHVITTRRLSKLKFQVCLKNSKVSVGVSTKIQTKKLAENHLPSNVKRGLKE